jgi:hypothetical protein
MNPGDVWDIQWYGGPAHVETVRLHYDGRDEVRFVGDVWDELSYHLSWDQTYTNEMTLGNHSYDSCSDAECSCHRFRVTFHVKKGADLFD